MTPRLDQELVARGLVRSRALAKPLIESGAVLVEGTAVRKPSTKVTDGARIEVTVDVDPYVSRAAHKLLAAFAAFPQARAAVDGAACVDVGASTGGFTQVLLEHGASSVVALDVGHGQLAAQVAGDPRVLNLEGHNIRDVTAPAHVKGAPFAVLVSDLSFISLTLAMPHIALLVDEHAHVVLLVKPQFEVGRERLGRTGVVTSVSQRHESVQKVAAAARAHGLAVHGLAWSPMVGTHGNHEYVMWLRPVSRGAGLSQEALTDIADGLVRRGST